MKLSKKPGNTLAPTVANTFTVKLGGRKLRPSEFIEEILNIQLLEWQKRVLDSYDYANRKARYTCYPSRCGGKRFTKYLLKILQDIYDRRQTRPLDS